MDDEDFQIYKVSLENDKEKESIYAVARFSGMGLDWPRVVKHCGKYYKFASNEVMEDWMIGNYSGHAKFSLTNNC